MPRIRTIKPEIHSDGRTGKLSDRAFRLFVGLLNFCDDYGVMVFDPDQVKAAILPHVFEDSSTGVVPFVEELHRARLIAIFDFVGQRYVWVRTFSRHQYVEKPSRPLLDGWSRDKSETAETFCKRCNGKICSPTTPLLLGEFDQNSEDVEPNSPTTPLPLGNPAEVRNGRKDPRERENNTSESLREEAPAQRNGHPPPEISPSEILPDPEAKSNGQHPEGHSPEFLAAAKRLAERKATMAASDVATRDESTKRRKRPRRKAEPKRLSREDMTP